MQRPLKKKKERENNLENFAEGNTFALLTYHARNLLFSSRSDEKTTHETTLERSATLKCIRLVNCSRAISQRMHTPTHKRFVSTINNLSAHRPV